MTAKEFEDALNNLSDEKFDEFKKKFGGDFTKRKEYVSCFTHHPDHELIICNLLGLKTENEKKIEATERSANATEKSANAAERSAKYARLAIICSVVGIIIAFISLIVSIWC